MNTTKENNISSLILFGCIPSGFGLASPGTPGLTGMALTYPKVLLASLSFFQTGDLTLHP